MRVPFWTNQYSMGPTGARMRTWRPGLLLDLAQRRLLDGLVAIRGPLGQRPGDAVAVPATTAQHELRAGRCPGAGRRRPRRSPAPPASAVRAGSVSLAMRSRRCPWAGRPRAAADSIASSRRQASAATPDASIGRRAVVRAAGRGTDGPDGRAAGRGTRGRAPGRWASGTPAAAPTAVRDAGSPAARTGSARWCRGRRETSCCMSPMVPGRRRIDTAQSSAVSGFPAVPADGPVRRPVSLPISRSRWYGARPGPIDAASPGGDPTAGRAGPALAGRRWPGMRTAGTLRRQRAAVGQVRDGVRGRTDAGTVHAGRSA